MSEFQPSERLLIADLETLKVVAHPLRTQILDQLGASPLTVKQVAHRLGLAPNKLYYHINLLEQHGLVRVVETRTVGNMIEKVYRNAAERYDVDADLLSFTTREGQEGAEQLVTTTIDATREDLVRSLEARRLARAQGAEPRPRQAMVTRCTSRIPEERADEFRELLRTLMEEFGNAEVEPSPGEDVETYALTVAFYPTFPFPEGED